LAGELAVKEKGWLRDVAEEVDFDDATLVELFPPRTLERARQAFVFLTR
jgi:hypothetical protein